MVDNLLLVHSLESNPSPSPNPNPNPNPNQVHSLESHVVLLFDI